VIGQIVNNYEVTRLLGEGGMGSVYLAEHPFLGRKAAIKVLKPECASNADLIQRFLNEARAANAIHHPNIIDIIDVGILPEGVPYMMMEFLQGESLADRLHRVSRLPQSEALYIAGQIASALAAAHAVDIVHRDLKPDNVFIVPDLQNPGHDHVKVLDFGIAKLRPEFAPGSPRTSAGALLGTPAYMSPEQCMGKTSEIDHRADIYALGVILFEMLCGRTPFEGQSYGEFILQHVTAMPVRPQSLNPEIPDWVDALILKALEKQSSDRIQTMNAFADMLAGKPMPATLVISGDTPAPMYPPRHVSEATMSLEEEPPAKREKTGSYSGSRRGRSTRPTPAATPPNTTLSSMSGQVRGQTWPVPAKRSGSKVAAIVISAVVLSGAVAVLGVRFLGKGETQVQQQSAPERTSASALPPFQPPSEPPKAPPPAQPSANDESALAMPHGEGKVPSASEVPENQPTAKGLTPTHHERTKGKSSSRANTGDYREPQNAESAGRHGVAERHPTIPENIGAAPTLAPLPVKVESPQKVITREKF
jgi:serine/threonine protein kinase